MSLVAIVLLSLRVLVGECSKSVLYKAVLLTLVDLGGLAGAMEFLANEPGPAVI